MSNQRTSTKEKIMFRVYLSMILLYVMGVLLNMTGYKLGLVFTLISSIFMIFYGSSVIISMITDARRNHKAFKERMNSISSKGQQ